MTRPLLVIFLTIFVNLVGFGIIVPLLPFYAERFGASGLTIGLLFGVFSLCQLVASPVLGELSDRYGRRPVLLAGLSLFVVGGVLSSFADSYAAFIAGRMLQALGAGCSITLARAIAGQPEIVFFDEPSAGLDPVTTSKIYDLLRAEREATGAGRCGDLGGFARRGMSGFRGALRLVVAERPATVSPGRLAG